MFFLLNDDQSLKNFITSSKQDDFLDFARQGVHPLFRHLQQATVRDNQVRREIYERRHHHDLVITDYITSVPDITTF